MPSALAAFRSYSNMRDVTSDKSPRHHLKEGLSPTFQVVAYPELQAEIEDIEKSGTRPLGSFSWSDDKDEDDEDSVMIVPGNARDWKPLPLPVIVEIQQGVPVVDNSKITASFDVSTNHVYEPLLRSIQILSPDFDLKKNMDVVLDRFSAMIIIGLARKGRVGRINCQLIGDTLFLSSPTSMGSKVDGFSSASSGFARVMTQDNVGSLGTSENWRIVYYKLDGLNIIVQAKANAQFEQDNIGSNDEQETAKPEPLAGSDLFAIKLGFFVPQDQILEIRTQMSPRDSIPGFPERELKNLSLATPNPISPSKEENVDTLASSNFITLTQKQRDEYAAAQYLPLWLSGTPNMICARHENGKFLHVDHYSIDEIRKHMSEKQNKQIVEQKSLFVAILKAVREVAQTRAKEGNKHPFALVGEGGLLKVFDCIKARSDLPQDLIQALT